MLKVFFRPAASRPRARLMWLAAPWACAWMAGAATALAADPPRQAASSDPFKHYQGWRDEPLQDWRAANERVDEVGGWRTYLRESQQAGAAEDEGGHGHDGAQGIEETP